jgi:hypothetical protein
MLREGKNTGGLGDGSPPTGSRGRAPVGVWGRSPQKLTHYAKLKPQEICYRNNINAVSRLQSITRISVVTLDHKKRFF